jgi:3-hydroxybutyryl-CoA dehydratase
MHVGHSFERRVRWTETDIVRFAEDVGDSNPLHHDSAYSTDTRFGGLIASGAHTVAVMMAVCGSQATREKPGVGLEFNFRLLGAAKPGEEIVFRWEIVAIEESERPRGTLVTLRGEAIAEGERLLLSATAKTLFVAVL